MKRFVLFLTVVLASMVVGNLPTAHASARPLLYVVFKNKFLSIDNFLEKKLNLHVDSCSFRSNSTHKVATFSNFGECVSLNLSESFSAAKEQDDAPGTMDVVLTNIKTNAHLSLEVIWRPGLGDRVHAFNRLYKDWKQETDTDDKIGLLGDITLKFPLGPLDEASILLKSFGAWGQALVDDGVHLSEIDISTLVDSWDSKYTDTSIEFLEAGTPKPFYEIKITSDFNLLNHKNPAHVEVDGQ